MAASEIIDGQYIDGSDSLDADTAREFADFIDEMRSTETADAWITVLRVPVDAQGNPRPNTKSVGQLFSEPMGAATVQDIVERIRDGFIRPGETKICVRIMGSTKGTGGKLRFNKVMTIEKANTKANDTRPDSVAEIMRVMQENQRINDERFERMMGSARVSVASDPIDQMTKMMTAMGAMMAPMMAVMAGRPMGAQTDPADSLVKLATTMKTLDGMFGGRGVEDEGGAAILKSIASIATPAIQLMAETKRNENERLRLAPPRRMPAPTNQRPPSQNKNPSMAGETAKETPAGNANEPSSQNKGVHDPEVDTVQLEEMKKNLDTVCDLRDSGKTPAQVAKLVLATVPAESDEAFLAMLDSDDYVPNMTLLNPRVGTNVPWAEALRKALLDEYEPDEEKPAAP